MRSLLYNLWCLCNHPFIGAHEIKAHLCGKQQLSYILNKRVVSGSCKAQVITLACYDESSHKIYVSLHALEWMIILSTVAVSCFRRACNRAFTHKVSRLTCYVTFIRSIIKMMRRLSLVKIISYLGFMRVIFITW